MTDDKQDAAALIQRQLDAFNAKDVDALLATYAADAELFELHGALMARGHEAMRPRFELRFAEPDLHARLLSRSVMAAPDAAGSSAVVVDLERITRNFAEGVGTLEMLCVYEVAGGLIRKASFAIGRKQVGVISS
jgi:putative hydrolase of HD superfamily